MTEMNKADAAQRQAFEAHVSAQDWCKRNFLHRHAADRPEIGGRYINPHIEEYWSIWQAAVLAERERCATLVETTPAEAFCTVMHQGQLQRARETFAAAIRKG